MGIFTIQNDFTHGQLDKTLVQRSDITLYKKAAARLENVIVLPEGGVQRRFGLDLFDPNIVGNTDEMIMSEFRFSVNKNYLLLFNENNGTPELRIYLDGPTGIPPLFNPPVLKISPIPWTAAQIPELRFTQSTNLMVITHPDVQPQQLFRGATDADWTLQVIAFSFVPVHDFVKGSYDAQTFEISALKVGLNRTVSVTAGTFIFTLAYVGGAFIAPGATIDATLGYAQITAINSPTQALIDIISLFGEDDVSPGGKSTYKGTEVIVAEKAWGDEELDFSGDRGWPKSCSFYQDRLWMGGSRSLPQSMFGSKVDDFVDFAPRTGQADDAINYELQSNFINPIEHVVGDRDFQIFTATSEWTPRQALDAPITPKSLSVHKHSSNGIDPTVRPVTMDNTTFFVKRGGRGVMSFGLQSSETIVASAVYTAQDISILSTDIIRQPVDSTTLRGFTRNNADYVLLVNGDGTLAIYQTLRSQNVSAWTIAQTNNVVEDPPKSNIAKPTLAPFKRVQSVGEDSVYCIVERNINGETRPSLEKINFDHFTDSTITQTFSQPTSLITGLDQLEGQFVQIRGSVDGSDVNMRVFPSQTVVTGTVDISEGVQPTLTVAIKKAEVGVAYQPLIETLPIVIDTQEGALNYIPKHVNRVFIAFFESLGIRVDGVLLPNLEFNDFFLKGPDDIPPSTGDNLTPSGAPQSGVFQFFEAGWKIQPTFTITQPEPLPMTILAIGYEVNT